VLADRAIRTLHATTFRPVRDLRSEDTASGRFRVVRAHRASLRAGVAPFDAGLLGFLSGDAS
jgi:hypothetical protein